MNPVAKQMLDKFKERHDLLLKIKTSNINQETLFDMIDREIDMLYKREKAIVTNRHRVGSFIDRLYFQLEGQKKIEYVRGASK